MASLIVALVIVGLEVGQIALILWVSRRTGMYAWAQSVSGPPRRDTPFFIRLQKLQALFLCLLLVSLPVQGAVVIVAGVAAAIGAL